MIQIHIEMNYIKFVFWKTLFHCSLFSEKRLKSLTSRLCSKLFESSKKNAQTDWNVIIWSDETSNPELTGIFQMRLDFSNEENNVAITVSHSKEENKPIKTHSILFKLK